MDWASGWPGIWQWIGMVGGSSLRAFVAHVRDRYDIVVLYPKINKNSIIHFVTLLERYVFFVT